MNEKRSSVNELSGRRARGSATIPQPPPGDVTDIQQRVLEAVSPRHLADLHQAASDNWPRLRDEQAKQLGIHPASVTCLALAKSLETIWFSLALLKLYGDQSALKACRDIEGSGHYAPLSEALRGLRHLCTQEPETLSRVSALDFGGVMATWTAILLRVPLQTRSDPVLVRLLGKAHQAIQDLAGGVNHHIFELAGFRALIEPSASPPALHELRDSWRWMADRIDPHLFQLDNLKVAAAQEAIVLRGTLDMLASALRHRQELEPDPVPRQSVQKDKKAEARDEWLYQECRKGKTYKAVQFALKGIARNRRWQQLGSPQAVQQAVDRYVKRNGLAPLPPRKQA